MKKLILLKPRILDPVFVVDIKNEFQCQKVEIAFKIHNLEKKTRTQNVISPQTTQDSNLLCIRRLHNDKLLTTHNPIILASDIAIQSEVCLIRKRKISAHLKLLLMISRVMLVNLNLFFSTLRLKDCLN